MSGGILGDGDCLVYIGTYTHGGAGGIHAFLLDAESGRLEEILPVVPAANPSYLIASADRRTLWAVFETDELEGRPGGAAASFAIDRRSGKLTETSRRRTGSRASCHLCADGGGRALYAANYGDGTVTVFPLNADGTIDPPAVTLRNAGSGPDLERQEGPHAHHVSLTPDGRFLCVVDLGIDRVMIHPVDRESGLPSPDASGSLALAPGSGPRHMAFHPSGGFAYVATELSNEVVACEYSGNGSFRAMQRVSALPDGFGGVSYCAAVRLSPDGRTLWVSNRGHDSVAAFTIDNGTGRLAPLCHTPSGGNWPRDIAPDPSGQWLLAANERSDTVAVFHIDGETGALRPAGEAASVPRPACVLFV